MESELITCPRCGVAVDSKEAPEGLCPSCLLQLGLESDPSQRKGIGRMGPAKPAGHIPRPEDLAPLFPELEILGVIGEGGMGIVYKARQRKLDRFVALKVLRQEIADDPAFAERFMREARALARLDHPSIVGVHDFGQVDGLYYFVMEYVDGTNLRVLLERGRLEQTRALEIVPRICDALQYAHDQGVVHRDIKPENILVDGQGIVKIADFSLAKLTGSTRHEVLTGTNQAMGTVNYMAPEQWKSPLAVDHRADLYSLGVVFYEMLTGDLPMGRFAVPSQRSGTDARLDHIVLKSLEREPEDRYQQAREIRGEIAAIDPVAAGQPGQPTRFGLTGQAAAMHWRSSGLTGWIAVSAFLGVLAAAFMPWVRFESDYFENVSGMQVGVGLAAAILYALALVVGLATSKVRPIPAWRPFALVTLGFAAFVATISGGASEWLTRVDGTMERIHRREPGLYFSAIAGLGILAFSSAEMSKVIGQRRKTTVSKIPKASFTRVTRGSLIDRLLGLGVLTSCGIGLVLSSFPWAYGANGVNGMTTWVGVASTSAFLLCFLLNLATRRLRHARWRALTTAGLGLVSTLATVVFLQDGALAAFPSTHVTLYKTSNAEGAEMTLFMAIVLLCLGTLQVSRTIERTEA
ncbi:MAG: serine/threonine-protein kinase [Planctomycetota bacterium]